MSEQSRPCICRVSSHSEQQENYSLPTQQERLPRPRRGEGLDRRGRRKRAALGSRPPRTRGVAARAGPDRERRGGHPLGLRHRPPVPRAVAHRRDPRPRPPRWGVVAVRDRGLRERPRPGSSCCGADLCRRTGTREDRGADAARTASAGRRRQAARRSAARPMATVGTPTRRATSSTRRPRRSCG